MSDIAAKICKAVAELPDRDSPQDWPAAMLVTHDELRQITIAALASAAAPQPDTAYAALPDAPTASDAMVDAYLKAQREAVEEADRFGRPNIGGLHTNTVREACRAGLNAALEADCASRGQAPAGWAIVPANATDAMMAAFAKAATADIDWHGATEVERQEVRDGFGPAYRAMLAAVPVPRPDSVLEDAGMLDWLEAQGTVAIERCKYLGSDDAVIEVTPYNDDSYEGDTLRDAIRAAMAAKKGDAT